MKKILILTILLICNGCATATITTETQEGKIVKCSGSYTSVFKDTDTMSLSACGSKGKSAGSTTNTLLIQELLKILIQ